MLNAREMTENDRNRARNVLRLLKKNEPKREYESFDEYGEKLIIYYRDSLSSLIPDEEAIMLDEGSLSIRGYEYPILRIEEVRKKILFKEFYQAYDILTEFLGHVYFLQRGILVPLCEMLKEVMEDYNE